MSRDISFSVQEAIFFIFFAVIVFFTFLVVKPFIITLLTAAVLAYITYPLYKKLVKLIRKRYISAFLMVLFVFLCLTLPVLFLGSFIINESVEGVQSIVSIVNEVLDEEECSLNNANLCQFVENIRSATKTEFFDKVMQKDFPSIEGTLLKSGSGFFFSVTGIIIQVFILLFTLFFCFLDGHHLANFIIQGLPVKKLYREQIVNRFQSITSGVIYGQLFTAIIQGVVAGIGYYIFEINSPIVFAMITIITSFVPFLGSGIVWLPLSVIKSVYAFVNNDPLGVGYGIGLAIYGFLIVSTIDNFIRPKLIGDKAQIHPVLALVGVLGGLSVFGIVGLLLGPFTMALFVLVFRIYVKDIKFIK